MILQDLVDSVKAKGSAIDMLDLLQTWETEELAIRNCDYADLLPPLLKNALVQSPEYYKVVLAAETFPYLLSKVVDPQLALEAAQLKHWVVFDYKSPSSSLGVGT